MNNLYDEFNLQLFADGEDTSSDEFATDFYLDNNGDLQTGKPPAEDPADEPEPADDAGEEPEPEDEDEEGAEDSGEEQPPAADKIKVKTVDGELDVTLDELKLGYMRQADYTRKTQETAQQQRLAQTLMEQFAQSKTPDAPAEKSAMDRYTEVAQAAKADVIRDLQLESADDFDELNLVHTTAYALKLNQMMKQADTIASREQAIASFEAQAKQQEPNYDRVYEYTKQRVNYLPYIERVQMEQAFNNGDTKTMNEFFYRMSKEFYEQNQMALPAYLQSHFGDAPKPKKVAKKAPPAVETTGTGEPPAKPKMRDATKLRGMESGDMAQWLIDNGLV